MTALQTNLARLLAARGWKTFHLAAAINDSGIDISDATIRRWVSGDREPQARYIPAIADALGVTPNELFAEEEPAPCP
jgi:transcriptional regulator with XRE-family HTH domain